MNPRSTDCEADALITTPSRRLDLNILTCSILAEEKNACFIVYITASPAELQSVTSGLIVLVQPVSPIRPCVKSYQTFMCLLDKKFSGLFCSFSYQNFSFQDPGYAFGLCSLFIDDKNPRGSCVSCSLEVGDIFLILRYLQSKYQKCLSRGAIAYSDAVFF